MSAEPTAPGGGAHAAAAGGGGGAGGPQPPQDPPMYPAKRSMLMSLLDDDGLEDPGDIPPSLVHGMSQEKKLPKILNWFLKHIKQRLMDIVGDDDHETLRLLSTFIAIGECGHRPKDFGIVMRPGPFDGDRRSHPFLTANNIIMIASDLNGCSDRFTVSTRRRNNNE